MRVVDITDEVGRRVLNILIAIDQLLWVLLTLGNGLPDETISAALWRMDVQGKFTGRMLRPFVDFLLRPFGPDHCYWAHVAEVKSQQQDRFHRTKS